MAPQVFPSATEGPHTLAAGASSGLVPFAEDLGPVPGGGPDDRGMFVAVAKSRSEGDAASGADPRLLLSAGDGPATRVSKLPQAVTIKDAAGTPVADAVYSDTGRSVLVIQLFVFQPGSDWKLEIVNEDAEARAFTWVVAPGPEGARQPWIEMAGSLTFDVQPGDIHSENALVVNRGTGRLVLGDPDGLDLGSGFELSFVPGPIQPNADSEVQIDYHAPATAGTVTEVYTAKSNDTVPGRRRSVTLRGITTVPPPTTTEVAVVAVVPPNGAVFRKRFAEGNRVAAMSAVFADPAALGAIVYAQESEAATDPAVFRAAADRLLQRFAGPIYTRVTYLEEQSADAVAVPVEIRDKRRRAFRDATTTADRGQLEPAPTSASLQVEPEVFEVARLNGVTQPALMIVEVVLPPIITALDPSGGRPGSRFEIQGVDLVFQAGDSVSVFWDAPTGPIESLPGFVNPGRFEIVGPPTPTRIVAVIPDVNEEIGFPLVVSRSDGTEGFSDEDLHISLL